jgi:beta-galactosidase/beta-glucuronidase
MNKAVVMAHRHEPTEREMKLTELFWRDRKQDDGHGIAVPSRPEHDGADRSSMADLVRLLKQADEAGGSEGSQPA